jgi:predicted nucleic acid-binding protein
MLWIADTGPLLHLHQADLIELLHSDDDIRTTPAVVSEWSRRVRGTTLPSWLKVEDPKRQELLLAEKWLAAGVLDQGEAESLAHAVFIRADGFLTDDTAAREFALGENLSVRGSLGVLLMAAARRRLPAETARAAWYRLANHSTLWISPALRREVDAAMERILARNPPVE